MSEKGKSSGTKASIDGKVVRVQAQAEVFHLNSLQMGIKAAEAHSVRLNQLI
jgi:hypothetical protein